MSAGRTIAASIAASGLVGWAVAFAFVVTGRPAGQATLGLALPTAALFLSAPLSIPLGLVGGLLASFILRQQRSHVSLIIWMIRGVGTGGALGALAAPVALLLVASSASAGAAGMAATFSIGGAVGGVVAGAMIGVWCYWSQLRPTTQTDAP
jgi:hypothetical protein